jgi:hypothetical protein
MSQRKEDMFIDGKSSISIKKDFLAFYDQSLKYLEKWFDL